MPRNRRGVTTIPRNGSGVYSKPAGTTAVPNTTIESAKYNATIDDLVDDANAARPVTSGGTGGNSAATARTNLGVDQAKVFVTKSGAYTAVAGDKNAHIRFDGAYTLSLTAAATLGAGWFCEVQADGGAVTIDPNASETINGATTLVIPDGRSVLIWCNGSAFFSTEDALRTDMAFAQCRLVLDGSNLRLNRFGGRLLTINGGHYEIPSGGVALAATGLTPSTLYYIYAYMNSTTMTLEASTTVPSTDSASGIQIKNGDATRTLVGLARPVTGPAWVDSATQRFVLSYYNRTTKAALNSFTADRTTASASYVELNTEIRTEFLAWGDEGLYFSSSGGMSQNGTSAVGARIALDGTADWVSQSVGGGGNGIILPVNANATFTPSVGYHYLTLLGFASGGATGTFLGTNALLRCYVHAAVKG